MDLDHLIPEIACLREKCKLKILLDAWREERPETYTVQTLKTILSQQVVNNNINNEILDKLAGIL